MNLIRSYLKRFVSTSVSVLRTRCVHWTTPLTSSLPLGTLADLARSKSELIAENALLRQQLIILNRQVKRQACTKTDRILLVLGARAVRAWKQALFIVQPETLLRWHREAYRLFWRRRSKVHATDPRISPETVALIQEMAAHNQLWGAERIRGELLKLEMHVYKRTIQKYMRSVRVPQPRGQKCSTFLHNHAKDVWACDALAGERSLLSLALCVLPLRAQLAESDPCRGDTVSYLRVDCTTTPGGDSLWTNAEVSHSR